MRKQTIILTTVIVIIALLAAGIFLLVNRPTRFRITNVEIRENNVYVYLEVREPDLPFYQDRRECYLYLVIHQGEYSTQTKRRNVGIYTEAMLVMDITDTRVDLSSPFTIAVWNWVENEEVARKHIVP